MLPARDGGRRRTRTTSVLDRRRGSESTTACSPNIPVSSIVFFVPANSSSCRPTTTSMIVSSLRQTYADGPALMLAGEATPTSSMIRTRRRRRLDIAHILVQTLLTLATKTTSQRDILLSIWLYHRDAAGGGENI